VRNTKSTFPELQDGQTENCEFDGVDVLLCRVAGRYYAVSNLCSHAGQALSEGKLRGFEISCPLHGARFDIRDGRCLAAPAWKPIATFAVVMEGDKVTVVTT